MHVQEPLHGPALLRLLDLQLGEETDEPLEGSLLSVDPEEVHFPQVHHLRFEIIGPAIGTLGTRVPGSPVSKHHFFSQKCQATYVGSKTTSGEVRGLNEGLFYIVVSSTKVFVIGATTPHNTTAPQHHSGLKTLVMVVKCKSSVGSAAQAGDGIELLEGLEAIKML